MVYGGYSYLDPEYIPDERRDFIALHWLRCTKDVEKCAEGVAAESSVGTWTDIKTINEKVLKLYRARVFRIKKVSCNSAYIWIAYPMEHFDAKNIVQILASIKGNIFGMGELLELKMLDVYLPKDFISEFKGPKFGVQGIRAMVGSEKRPHIGTIVKPKVGLSADEWAQVAMDAYTGGVDFVKDDENLVDQDFCKWTDRVDKMMDVISKVEDICGRRVLYAPNISDTYTRMIERLDYLEKIGHNMAMLDMYVVGHGAAPEVIEYAHERGIAIHAHRAGYAAEARGKFGCDFQVYAKLWRLYGVDQLHVGTGVGKMEGNPALIRRYAEIVREKSVEEKMHMLSLAQNWDGLKNVMPVASGGLNPGLVPSVMAIFGRDVVIQAGGGIHGHPDGTKAGAKAMRDAVEAVINGEGFTETMSRSNELRKAIEKWGYLKPHEVVAQMEFIEKNAEIIAGIILSKGYDAFTAIFG